jgi:hypothetical protein
MIKLVTLIYYNGFAFSGDTEKHNRTVWSMFWVGGSERSVSWRQKYDRQSYVER